MSKDLETVVGVLARAGAHAEWCHGRQSLDYSKIAYLICEVAEHTTPEVHNLYNKLENEEVSRLTGWAYNAGKRGFKVIGKEQA
ncbi:MAG: hypothetical protein ACXAB9_15350 [Candidatus Thorarchaeota archaeon]|jgi:hypothetical protein